MSNYFKKISEIMARLDSSSEELEENEYAVEKIIKDRVIKGKHKYYIKWEGYSDKYNSWIEEKDLDCSKLLEQYHQSKKEKESKSIEKKRKEDHELPQDYGKWELLKPDIITIQMRENSNLHVELQLNDKKMTVPLEQVEVYCPMALNRFYRKKLRFKA